MVEQAVALLLVLAEPCPLLWLRASPGDTTPVSNSFRNELEPEPNGGVIVWMASSILVAE